MRTEEYSAKSIQILSGLEHVRKRPAMYIGDVSERGLHHLIYEVLDNSIDEVLAGYCTKITVVVEQDGSISIQDNGRGIPTDEHPTEKVSALELVMTKLNAGGKFNRDSYKVSGGLHGVGVSVVNALSEWLEVTVYRNEKIYYQKYIEGKPIEKVKEIGTTFDTGTTVRFKPSNKIFRQTEFKSSIIEDRLQELSYLNTVEIEYNNKLENVKITFRSNGLIDYLDTMLNGKQRILKHSLYIKDAEKEHVKLDLALQYTTTYSENIKTYVNNINTIEGGTHLEGLKTGLSRTLNTLAIKNNLYNPDKIQLTGDDFREGLNCIISLKIPEPQFEGQTKAKLGNSEIKGLVQSIISEALTKHFSDYPTELKKVIDKCLLAAKAREASRKAKEIARKQVGDTISSLPGKLSDCSSRNAEDCELYLVEGDSAGGSAKQGRDRKYQAILPLKGKILNVEKATFENILDNEEIKTMYTALGINLNRSDQDINLSKIRYGKIIIMCDADVDGSHIKTLLLTFFYRYLKQIILDNRLYIAQPPLYKIKKGRSEWYVFNEDKLKNMDTTDCAVTRFKGLGEMNPEQLWQTTMDPENRTLLLVTIEDGIKADVIFKLLMGSEVEPRKRFIEESAVYASDQIIYN